MLYDTYIFALSSYTEMYISKPQMRKQKKGGFKTMKKIFATCLTAVLTLSLLSACSQSPSTTGSAAPKSSDAANGG